jgi:CheY-like chemotaxis protein
MSDKPLAEKRILWIDDDKPIGSAAIRTLRGVIAAQTYFVHITSERKPFDVLDALLEGSLDQYITGYRRSADVPEIDLLVTDRQMPGQSGEQVIDEAFELVDGVYRPKAEYANSLGGIVVAASPFPEMTQLEQGGILSLQKPYAPEQLVETLTRSIQHYESLRE